MKNTILFILTMVFLIAELAADAHIDVTGMDANTQIRLLMTKPTKNEIDLTHDAFGPGIKDVPHGSYIVIFMRGTTKCNQISGMQLEDNKTYAPLITWPGTDSCDFSDGARRK